MDWNLLGHGWAVSFLAKEVALGNLSHAYLLSGQPGVGRRTLALRLAQALNCPTPPAPGDACRACRTCKQIENMTYPDLSIIEAEQVGGTLRVDQVRELMHSLTLSPYEAKFRVALLLRFEEAHPSAMNALLKTLEEPPPRVVIVLTAESPESLLPTISSRCEILRLQPMPVAELSQSLQNKFDLLDEKANLIAHLSAGRPGMALRMAQKPEILANRDNWIRLHQKTLTASRRERFSLVDDLNKEREFLREGLGIWLSLWRDVLLASLNTKVPVVNLDLEEEITRLAGQFGPAETIHRIQMLEKMINLIDSNINQRLAFEVLMLDLPYPGR